MKKRYNAGTWWHKGAAVILSLLLCGSYVRAENAIMIPEASALVEKTRPALVLLVSLDRHGKEKSCGTGFFISEDGILVTARHVAQSEQNLVAVTQKGEKFAVTGFIGEDRDCDISVLKIPCRGSVCLSLANQALPQKNQWAALVSARDFMAPPCSTGVVQSIITVPGLFTEISTTVPNRPGQSGSPLLNAEGEVIGVVPYISPHQSAVASPIASIREIIARAGTNPPVPFAKRPSNGSDLPLSFNADFRSALQAFQRHDWPDAERRFRRVAKSFPESPLAFTFLSMSQMRCGKLEKAVASAERAQQLKPDSAMPYFVKGLCQIDQNHPSEGVLSVRKALEIGLSGYNLDASGWEVVAQIERSLGHHTEAQQALANLERLNVTRAAELREQFEAPGPRVNPR